MATTVIGYVNLASSVSTVSSWWEADAPIANVLTPRLGQMVIAVEPIGEPTRQFVVYLGSGSPTASARCDIIALLNHNIISAGTNTDFEIYITCVGGNAYNILNGMDYINLDNADGTFQKHIIWYATQSFPALANERVETVTFIFKYDPSSLVTGKINPYTGVIEREPLSFGGVWVGPAFAPRHGIAIDGFSGSLIDGSQVVRSIGGQVWAEPEVRQRTMKVQLPGMKEPEVYGFAPSQCLQQLSAYCGVSRPLIVVPTTDTEELVYTQGIYGYLTVPASWNLQDKTKDPTTGQMIRLYTGSLDIVEAR